MCSRSLLINSSMLICMWIKHTPFLSYPSCITWLSSYSLHSWRPVKAMRWKTQGNYLTRNFGCKIPFKPADLVLSAMSRQWLWKHLLWIFFTVKEKKKKTLLHKALDFLSQILQSPWLSLLNLAKQRFSFDCCPLLWIAICHIAEAHCDSLKGLCIPMLFCESALSYQPYVCSDVTPCTPEKLLQAASLWILYNLSRESLWKHAISL